MSTEQLTAEEQALENARALHLMGGTMRVRTIEAMKAYAAQQVEQQTKQLKEELEKSQNSNSVLGEGWHRLNEENKQLKEERDRAVDLINRADGIINYSGFAIHPESPFAKWVKDFLKQLNQNNEE